MAFLGRLIGWLAAFPSLDISVNSCEIHSTGSTVRQRIHYRLSIIVWRCVLGIVPTYLLELFILTSSCTGRQSLRSASRVILWRPHTCTAIKQHRAFSIVDPSVWNSLPPLFHGICPARFTSSLKLLFSPGPGLGAPLSSYLEVKWRYINSIDRYLDNLFIRQVWCIFLGSTWTNLSYDLAQLSGAPAVVRSILNNPFSTSI